MPALTLLLHVDIRFAIGASIVSVIATSSGAAAAYVRDGMTNLRVAMFLELGTTAGALSGAYLAGVVPVRTLYLVFGLVMGYSALAMFRKRHADLAAAVPADALADRLALHGSYVDEAVGREIHYPVTGSTIGLGLMYVAGVVSGLLGIGSGALAGPVVMGVLTGALGGSRLLGRLQSSVIRKVFVAVLLWVSLEMLLKGL